MPDTISLTAEIGKVRGHLKFKENRVSKLLARWGELREKFEGMVVRGRGTTDTARYAYGCLLMMHTGIRTGRESIAEGFVCQNKFHPDFGKEVQTYGLTTLLGSHVERHNDSLFLSFTGKKLVAQSLTVEDPFVVRWAPDPEEAPDRPWLGIEYGGLYSFVKERVGRGYSPKDLRMAFVNSLFVLKFVGGGYAAELEKATAKSARKAIVRQCIEETATQVGHTAAVCRSSYLSTPLQRVLANYQAGTRITE